MRKFQIPRRKLSGLGHIREGYMNWGGKGGGIYGEAFIKRFVRGKLGLEKGHQILVEDKR